ncbi:(2Fe-2S)-binding protein [Bacillus cereus]|nr:(2Fe-2S)-binding protein [Bacillus cereus]PGA29847.1 (2Fe-2S)-binding protein [Bacillus thuringiensis]PEW56812.1 (2Fe-2S)-binding protein [Bacillus cereus]PEX55229.1 (2Fe-2S)-binding protein [Bacillus cereus]PEZ87024.1 (2Fe-2S)-binding protein [Bacillus cereus]
MIFAYIICENRTRGGIHMTNKNNLIVCRCEEVTYGQLQSTIAEYNCSARELKLRTRASMGFCGGRTCRIMIDRMIENANPDVTLNELPLKYQPPIRAVTFGSVGESK